jgi:hypothetical protein
MNVAAATRGSSAKGNLIRPRPMNGKGIDSPEKLAEVLIGRRISQTMSIEYAGGSLNDVIFLFLSEFATSRGEERPCWP